MTGSRVKVRCRGLAIYLVVLLFVLLATTPSARADITYIYDELGRLRALIDPFQTDGTAIYTYDAVGNILSIPATIEFKPEARVRPHHGGDSGSRSLLLGGVP